MCDQITGIIQHDTQQNLEHLGWVGGPVVSVGLPTLMTYVFYTKL